MVNGVDAGLAAGHLSCDGCGAVTYPVEARWLDETWVIARFPTACDHTVESVRLVAPTTLPVDGRCQGMTRAGTRCKLPVTTRGWCGIHLPACLPDGGGQLA